MNESNIPEEYQKYEKYRALERAFSDTVDQINSETCEDRLSELRVKKASIMKELSDLAPEAQAELQTMIEAERALAKSKLQKQLEVIDDEKQELRMEKEAIFQERERLEAIKKDIAKQESDILAKVNAVLEKHLEAGVRGILKNIRIEKFKIDIPVIDAEVRKICAAVEKKVAKLLDDIAAAQSVITAQSSAKKKEHWLVDAYKKVPLSIQLQTVIKDNDLELSDLTAETLLDKTNIGIDRMRRLVDWARKVRAFK